LFDQLRPGDHICWTFRDDEARRRGLAGYVRAGLRQGQRVLCLTEPAAASTVLAELTAAGVDAPTAVARGELSVLDSVERYFVAGEFDPEAMLHGLRREAEAARSAGFPGIRVAGDMSWAARSVRSADRLASYEARVNRFFAEGFATGLCQYDSRVFSEARLRELTAAHPATIGPACGPDWMPLLRIRRTSDPFGVHLDGEIDLSNRSALSAVLDGLLDDAPDTEAPVNVDVSAISFIDAAGARMLCQSVATAAGRIRLTGHSPAVARLLSFGA